MLGVNAQSQRAQSVAVTHQVSQTIPLNSSQNVLSGLLQKGMPFFLDLASNPTVTSCGVEGSAGLSRVVVFFKGGGLFLQKYYIYIPLPKNILSAVFPMRGKKEIKTPIRRKKEIKILNTKEISGWLTHASSSTSSDFFVMS